MNLRQRFESLLIYDPNRSPMAVNVWISRPSVTEEQALGKLVVIASLENNDRLHLDVINLIQEELRNSYYQSIDSKPDRAFEHALQQVNRRLHLVITDGVASWVETASILIAVTWRDQCILSSVGNMPALLLRHGRMHDLLDVNTSTPVNPVRMFSQIVSGQLQSEDQLLMATPSLLDFFSMEKLRRTMSDGSPSAAVHQWETTLLGIEQQAAIGAVILKVQAEEQVITPIGRPEVQSTLYQSAPQASMERLIAKEQSTQELLSPSLWPAVRDIASQFGHGLQSFGRRLIRKPPRRVIPASTSGLTIPKPPSASAVRNTLRSSSTALWSGIVRVISAFRRSNSGVPRTPEPASIAPTLRPQRLSLNSAVRWFQHLNQRQQLFLGATVILLLVLAVAVIPRHQSPRTTANTPSVSIEDHIAQARAALLYGGEATAQEHLASAQTAVQALPHRTTKEKDAQQGYQKQLDELVTQLAHHTVITSPTIIAQLNVVAPNAQPQQLYFLSNHLIATDPTTSTVVNVTLGKDAAPTIIPQTQDIGKPQTGTVSTATTVTFATDRLGYIDLDVTKNTWKQLDATWPASEPRVQAITAYQNRVYALDAGHSTIVRFAHSATSLGTGALWLKEAASLGSARSIAVDGSVYILQPNNTVEEYANGRKGTFTVPTVTPALGDLTRMWTDVTSTSIYLLDQSKNRIVVISKSGKLIDQYTSPSWTALRDFAINEKTKTAYVLNGTVITSFTLLH